MIKIGITGSLASGKTTVAKIISSKKNPLFDADKSVKRIYQSSNFKSKVFKKFKLKNRNNIKDDLKKIILKSCEGINLLIANEDEKCRRLFSKTIA